MSYFAGLGTQKRASAAADEELEVRAMHEERSSQNSPDCLRLRWLRLRLLGDPGVERRLKVGIQPKPYSRADPRLRPAALLFLALSYCTGPRFPLSDCYSNQSKAGTSPRL
jgi:hypothetical protein